ncbi:MAG: sulfite reductase subunit alpha [Hyphomicrobium sp. 32-62-53]|nr:MAG: sulfite reductase subunit alpha [Hyphomicrobium sp. 12-62-95]OYY00738.1 MAG: sulfite reductase subunit alpha [Hyphomicrobium sp. 32-62-53]
MALPPLPKNAPFSAEDLAFLNQLVQRSTPLQRSWLSGFLAGLDAAQGGAGAAAAVQAVAQRPRVPLTILYGSESGNAEALAYKAKKLAGKLNCDAKVVDMGDIDVAALAKSKNLAVYISTWGEGDPPQRAVDFYKDLMSDAAPRLDGVKYAVLALGDTAYVNFCETGKKIDARLTELGATRIHDRIDLDLDFAKQAAAWTDALLEKFSPAVEAPSATVVHVDFKGVSADDEPAEPLYTAEDPAEAEVSALVNLNGSGSTRETYHVELAVEADGFTYEPGAAIGVLPENDPALAAEVARAVGLDGDASLVLKIAKGYDITTLSRATVDAFANLTGRTDVATLTDAEALAKFSADRQLVDLLATYPEKLTAEQLLGLLRPLPGRLYSVASSIKAHPGEAHLLVGAVRWESHGRKRGGVASTYFADRRKVGDKVRIYVKPNRHYALPADGNRPIIMIGAGTGVAPYRGFIEDRVETGAAGKSWLFFGERNYTNDFLYQLEWQEHLASGALTKIDVAFSRDQPEKIYVQHRLWEQRQGILAWLDDGAHLYVCGDEKGMAKDVDNTLVKILAEPLKGDEEAGRAKLKELTKAGRYQRDVY